jgi:predicted house-cleaning noncanonical NTP pyrophosphatase (MazG superfamily)
MKFKLIQNEIKNINDDEAVENLINRIEVITKSIELFNNSDWKLQEVAMWLQYEKDLALTEAKLFEGNKQ